MSKTLNPNTSAKEKFISAGWLVALIGALTALSPLAIDTYLPAIGAIAEEMNTSHGNVEATLALYMIGFAVGQFFGGAFSDLKGRKPVGFAGLLLFTLASLWISVGGSIYQLWTARFIQAIGGGFTTVVGLAIIRDLFDGVEIARKLTAISMVRMLAPLIAPMFGTLLLRFFGWRSIFIFFTIYAALMFLVFSLRIKETKAKSKEPEQWKSTLENYGKVIRNKQAIAFMLMGGLGFAGMFAFISGASSLFIGYYGVTTAEFPFYFSTNVLMLMILSALNVRLVKQQSPERLLKYGLRLQFLAGGVFLLASLLQPSLMLVFPAIALFVGAQGLIYGNASGIVMNYFPTMGGTANATMGIVQFILGGITSFVLSRLQGGESLLPLAAIMLSCTFLANLLYFGLSRRKPAISHP
ncbi:Bcr/CflA family multidrug efflux MFS transporter [Rapidithrix thailandica]|uniref:Bcr/CflA family multidrug efflux MFS transporter n=1 Tax=Rapidithrix thailandica TaxID=413964 RepID=A0AAW9RR94_9BACT